MQAFDTSSILYAWDNYPIGQFPPLWDWMGEQFEVGEFVLSDVAMKETKKKDPDCAQWLKDHSAQSFPTTNKDLQIALIIKSLLGIRNDKYGSGVGENDILIISSAKVHGHLLITNEAVQNHLPKKLTKYKIPAVCAMPTVAVPCMNFLELMKRSNEVFQ